MFLLTDRVSCCGLAAQGVAVALFLIFSRPPRLVKDVHNLDDLMDPLVKSMTENSNGGTAYKGSVTLPSSCPIPTERPPGMDGIIACSSYKNRLGTWNRKESKLVIGSQMNSYLDESRGLLGWWSTATIYLWQQFYFCVCFFFFLNNTCF